MALGAICLFQASPAHVWLDFEKVVDAFALPIHVGHFGRANNARAIVSLECARFTNTNPTKTVINCVILARNAFLIDLYSAIHTGTG